jgi:hypothetical protein
VAKQWEAERSLYLVSTNQHSKNTHQSRRTICFITLYPPSRNERSCCASQPHSQSEDSIVLFCFGFALQCKQVCIYIYIINSKEILHIF